MVTPLHESVTRVTAPDTETRLSGLVTAHAPGPRGDGTGLFLVSFYSDQPDVPFVPEEVQFISRGLRVRPQEIVPVTPSWGEQRVGQRQTEMAVYSFGDGVDLESSLILAYQFDQSPSGARSFHASRRSGRGRGPEQGWLRPVEALRDRSLRSGTRIGGRDDGAHRHPLAPPPARTILNRFEIISAPRQVGAPEQLGVPPPR